MNNVSDPKKLDFVYATDENYVFLTMVSMTSLFENNQLFDEIHIWILGDSISELSQKRLADLASDYNRRITILDVSKYSELIQSTGARKWGDSYAAYARLFVAEILEEYGVHKIIYGDCDLIIDGSLYDIWDSLMDNKPIGLCKEYNRVEIRDLLGLSRDSNYFQSGFLIMDLDKWKEKKCLQRILNHMENVRAVYPFVDQDLISAVLNEDIYVLPIEYNVNPLAVELEYDELCYVFGLNDRNYYSKTEFEESIRNGNNPIVYHCSQPNEGRPWMTGNRNAFSEIWNHYYSISSVKEWYEKKPFEQNYITILEGLMKRMLPRRMYLYFYKNASRWFMVHGIVNKYR